MRRMLERLSELRKIKSGRLQETADRLGIAKSTMPGMKMVIDYLHYNLYQK